MHEREPPKGVCPKPYRVDLRQAAGYSPAQASACALASWTANGSCVRSRTKYSQLLEPHISLHARVWSVATKEMDDGAIFTPRARRSATTLRSSTPRSADTRASATGHQPKQVSTWPWRGPHRSTALWSGISQQGQGAEAQSERTSPGSKRTRTPSTLALATRKIASASSSPQNSTPIS